MNLLLSSHTIFYLYRFELLLSTEIVYYFQLLKSVMCSLSWFLVKWFADTKFKMKKISWEFHQDCNSKHFPMHLSKYVFSPQISRVPPSPLGKHRMTLSFENFTGIWNIYHSKWGTAPNAHAKSKLGNTFWDLIQL